MTKKLGLYLHVPYCAALCSYCDFAKTANHSPELMRNYLLALEEQTRCWLTAPQIANLASNRVSTVFFGGGTPSLFAGELAPTLAAIRPFLAAGAEVSLEANPDDLSELKLQAWRDHGVNRLSVGVQSFDSTALGLLGRTHDASLARERLSLALKYFPNLNVDLIYGWPGQTVGDWQKDLAEVLALGVPHLSLYCLTFESRTVLGRKSDRGVISPPPDDDLAQLYQVACDYLGAAGFEHEEVSNWSKPGHSCSHNWLYWEDHYFIGVGAGAHGYLPTSDHWGVRYAYPRNDRIFAAPKFDEASAETLVELAQLLGAEVDSDRTRASWLTELVGSGLRTKKGVNITHAAQRCDLVFKPTANVDTALRDGILSLDGKGNLTLRPDEWFRESGWCVEILRSCVPRD
jgi:oxygen-independent coproporphyrinogen-3 oxidase